MNENVKWFAGAVAVVGLSIGAVVFMSRSDKAPPPVESAADVLPPPVAAEEPAIQHPLPEVDPTQPLPPLAESDGSMRAALEEVLGKQPFEQFLVPDELVRHVVVSIDNLTNEKVAERVRPVKRPPGTFVVSGTDEAPVLDAANYERYQPLVQWMHAVDSRQLVAVYTRYYPLFQEAYESLGHPPQYFNDRLIEVIDHLLAAPDLQGPIALAQPNVMYEFADPELESRSAGQKLLMRMGSANAAEVKEKLTELRGEISRAGVRQ